MGAAPLENIDDTLAYDVDSKIDLLGRLRAYLESLPSEEARTALMPPRADARSAFLGLFESAIDNLPAPIASTHRLWLQVASRKLQPWNVPLSQLHNALQDVQLLGAPLAREQYLSVLSAIFAAPGTDDAAVREQSVLAMEVIDTMYTRGETVLDPDVLGTVIESLVRGGSESPETQRLLKQFEDLFSNIDLPCPSEDILLRLMDAYHGQRNWDRFWEMYRIPARYARPRSQRIYTYIFQCLANTTQGYCVERLLPLVDQMVNEEPPVYPKGDLFIAIRNCIRVADPGAEAKANNYDPADESSVNVAKKEFVRLWMTLHAK